MNKLVFNLRGLCLWNETVLDLENPISFDTLES
jgi:hypothetical protein